MACRESQGNDDVNLRIGFKSIEGRVQFRRAPITVQSCLGRYRQYEAVAIDRLGSLLEVVCGDPFSCGGAIDEDTDAHFSRGNAGSNREQDGDSQCPGEVLPSKCSEHGSH